MVFVAHNVAKAVVLPENFETTEDTSNVKSILSLETAVNVSFRAFRGECIAENCHAFARGVSVAERVKSEDDFAEVCRTSEELCCCGLEYANVDALLESELRFITFARLS